MENRHKGSPLTEGQDSVLESATMKVVCTPCRVESSSRKGGLQDPEKRFTLKQIAVGAAALGGALAGVHKALTDLEGVIKALTFASRAVFGAADEPVPASHECQEMIGELVPALRDSTKISGMNWIPADNNTKIVEKGLIIGPEEAARAFAQLPQENDIFTPFSVGDPYEIAAPRLQDVFTFKTLNALRELRCAVFGRTDSHKMRFPGRHFISSDQIFDTKVRGAQICAGHPGSNRFTGLVTGYALVRDDPNRRYERRFVGTPGLDLPIRFLLDSTRTEEINRTKIMEHGGEKVVPTWHLQVDRHVCSPNRDAQGELPEDYVVLSYLPNFLASDSLEYDSIFLIEGLHGVGTEASRLLWRNPKLLNDLLQALKSCGMPQYWQALFFARHLNWRKNPKGVPEQTAESLVFGRVFEVRPDFKLLETYGKNLKVTFEERWGNTSREFRQG